MSHKIHRKSEEDVNEQARSANLRNNIATCTTIHPANIRNHRTGFDDETWLMELIGSEATGPNEATRKMHLQIGKYLLMIRAVAESDPSEEAQLISVGVFCQHLKIQPGAEPDLPRTPQPLVTPISAAPCTTNGLHPSPRTMMKIFTTRSGFGSGGPCSVFKQL